MKLALDSLNHSGKGNFAEQKLDLDTKTTTKLSFDMDGTNYMKNVALSLDAVLGIDLDNMKFEFKDNKARITSYNVCYTKLLRTLEAYTTSVPFLERVMLFCWKKYICAASRLRLQTKRYTKQHLAQRIL